MPRSFDPAATRPLRRLGKMTVAEFMRTCWQRRPRVLRQVLAETHDLISPQRLFALAADPSVHSRLVTASDGRWRMRSGPIARLPALSRARWTVLVHSVEQHELAAAQLLARFRFLPDARLDDVMVSYASDRGGVGPHVDSYDVFLLQLRGRRRWRISRQRELQLVPDLPLRILRRFRPSSEAVLGPGDMLYLPPGVAHEGVAVGGDCVTCSIGFRAPPWRALIEPCVEQIVARPVREEQRYRDPELRATRRPAALPSPLAERAWRELRRALAPTRNDATAALLAVLTEPAPHVTFAAPASRLTLRTFAAALRLRELQPAAATRLMYFGSQFAINGEVFSCRADGGRRLLHRLADRRAGTPREWLGADESARRAVLAALYDWHCSGWLHIGPTP